MCVFNAFHTHRSPQRPSTTSYTWEYKPRNPYNHFQVSRAETSTLPAAVSLPGFALNVPTVQPLDARFQLSFLLQTSLLLHLILYQPYSTYAVGDMINDLLQGFPQTVVQRRHLVTAVWINSKFPHLLPLLPVPLRLLEKLNEESEPPFCFNCSLRSCAPKAPTAILGSLRSSFPLFYPSLFQKLCM